MIGENIKTSGIIQYCEEPPSDQSTLTTVSQMCDSVHFSSTSDPISALTVSSGFAFTPCLLKCAPLRRMGTGPVNHQPTLLVELCVLGAHSAQQACQKLQDRGSFKVFFIFIFIQVQVAVRTGDLKEVSLCQTQLTRDVLP